MRIHLHDYSGHPFQVQLSRALAARGHEVVHGYSTQYVTGHGRLQVEDDDPRSLEIRGFSCDQPLIKYSPVGRARFEFAYARVLVNWLAHERFDLVVVCNVPLFALARVRRYFARRGQPWVMWHQDIYSLAVGQEAARLLPGVLGALARYAVERIEHRQLASASAVIAITGGMLDQYRTWGLRRPGVHVIPNWAPLDDITPGVRDNAWAREHELATSPVRLVYAGTLGRKHNPLLLLELLDALRRDGVDGLLVVASAGDGADQLRAEARGRKDVRIVGYQPAERFSEMLASADAVVAVLEPDAARYSVPSKVLSYLSAGRPIIALVPDGNPAADDVMSSGGFVGPPTRAGALNAASWLRDAVEAGELARLGAASRRLAEKRFDIATIADSFEQIFAEAAGESAERSSEGNAS